MAGDSIQSIEQLANKVLFNAEQNSFLKTNQNKETKSTPLSLNTHGAMLAAQINKLSTGVDAKTKL